MPLPDIDICSSGVSTVDNGQIIHELADKATNCDEEDKSDTRVVGALLVNVLPLDASCDKIFGAMIFYR